MAEAIFTYEQQIIKIQCNKNQKMKDICKSLSTKINEDINTLIFLGQGVLINLEKTFNEITKENKISILVYKADIDICPKCGRIINNKMIDNIISMNNNTNYSLIGIKRQIEQVMNDVINKADINFINQQLNNINLIVNNISENIRKISNELNQIKCNDDKTIKQNNNQKDIKNNNALNQNNTLMIDITPITVKEINELLEKDKSMCKILYERLDKEPGISSGFFCKLDNFPIKYALFTNNHILNESSIELGKNIYFEYLEKSSSFFSGSSYNLKKKKLEITEKRRVFTNKELNYTCIELFESDGIYDYFHIDPNLFKYDNKYLINNDIFILQYPYGNELSFSFGKILSIVNNDIKYNAATEIGSSGSPIIRRCKDNYVIGIHIGGVFIHSRRKKYNIGTTLFSILENIKEQINDKIK